MTIHDLWTTSLRTHATLPALGWVDETPWTYAEVDRRVRSLQARFRSGHLAAGDKVALWSPNHPGWGVVYLAVTTGPLTVVPLLPEFPPADVATVLLHGEVKVLVVSRGLAELWTKWFDEAPEERRTALAGLRIEILEDLVEVPDPGEVPDDPTLPRPKPSDLAALIYTSGTTGSPKGVMLTHSNLATNIRGATPLSKLQAGHRMLSILPLAHTYECTLGLLVPLWAGCQVSYLSKPASPAVLLPALLSVRPHAILTVPLFIEKIYRQKILPGLNHGILRWLRKVPGLGWTFTRLAGRKLMQTFGGRVHFFGIGGAPLAPEVARFLHRAGFPYAIGYGLTETSPLVAGHLKVNLYSTGRVLAGVEVRIAEPRDSLGAGEILVRGPNVMAGYYKDPEQTAAVLSPDGWFKTGDLGLFDRQGHLYIKGRSKNLILGPSGENIYPEDLEALLNQDNRIVESLVFQRGNDIGARVVVNTDLLPLAEAPAYLEGLREQVNRQLARFSRLSFLEIQPAPFEKTATLKIKRYLYH